MTHPTLRTRLTADATHTIHFTLPPEMGDEVDVIIMPRIVAPAGALTGDSLAMAHLADQTGFARDVLSSPEEDCWNDL
jgi:hypothetical protein